MKALLVSRAVTNICSDDDMDDLAEGEKELAKLIERLNKAYTTYSMEITAEKPS